MDKNEKHKLSGEELIIYKALHDMDFARLKDREIIVYLRVMTGYSYRQIAEILASYARNYEA